MKRVLSGKLPLILIAVLVLGVLAGGAYIVLGTGSAAIPHVAIQIARPDAAAADATPVATPQQDDSVPVTLGERVVNLADQGGYRYLKAEVVLGLVRKESKGGPISASQLKADQTAFKADLDLINPQIQDVLTSTLTSKTVADVAAPDGKEMLKRELASRIQPLLTKYNIVGVYFAQFVIQ